MTQTFIFTIRSKYETRDLKIKTSCFAVALLFIHNHYPAYTIVNHS